MERLIAFFTSYEVYQPYCIELTNQQYQDLMYGTNANIIVPLWASCKNGEKVLKNEVTVEVIQFYKKHGYTPQIIDGNPEDYLGEQLLFIEYLCKAKCEDVEEFKNLYYIDTAMNFINALPYTNQDLEIIKKELIDLIDHNPTYDTFVPLNNPIELDEFKMICSAGINNCGGKCRIDVGVQEGCIIKIDTDRVDHDPQIRACVRGRGYKRTFMHAERLRYPMKRIGKRGEGRFTRISYEEAAKIIADKMVETLEKYGPASRYSIYSTGISAVMRPSGLITRLMSLQGGYLGFYNSYSSACASYVTPYIYGNAQSGNSENDMVNSKLIILWGHNPSETIFGSNRNYYLAKAKRLGCKIIIIDPRESDSVLGYASQWIPIKPSTDSALADAMAYVIYEKGLQDQHFMDTFCQGFDKDHMPAGYENAENVYDYLMGNSDGIKKDPAWASKITGIDEQTIIDLAIEYATTKPASIMPGLGLQRTINGEQTERSLAMLCAMTGNIGIAGGGAAGANWCGEHANPHLPPIANPYKGLIPTFLWFKAVREGTSMQVVEDGLKGVNHLDSNIKLIFNLAGNCLINQHSNINETISILQKEDDCELIVGSDLFMTPSAKFADLLLPGTSVFEGNNIALPWTFGSYVLHNTKAIEPLFGCQFEYEWIKLVAKNLDLYDEFIDGHETVDEWLEYCYNETRKVEPELPEYEVFKQRGGHVYEDQKHVVAYEKQIKEGIPFNTPSGKIEIFSPRLYDMNNPEEIPGIPKYTPCIEGPDDPLIEKYPLQLIGYHTKRRCHSVHDNNDYMEQLDPPAIWIHPDDAKDRHITDGEMVQVFNDRGIVQIPAKVTTRIMKGVIAMSQGGWYTPNEKGIDTRGSINVLTLTHKPSPLAKGNPQHTNLADVRKL